MSDDNDHDRSDSTSLDQPPRRRTALLRHYLKENLNFFRLHLLYITSSALFWSAIFWASNGDTHVSYVDCLFNSVSAMTDTGLATIDLSSITTWQQVILFIQMLTGNIIFVSWWIVYLRKRHFARAYAERIANMSVKGDLESSGSPWLKRVSTTFQRTTSLAPTPNTRVPDSPASDEKRSAPKQKKGVLGKLPKKLQPGMIRRLDDAPKLVNPSGWVTDEKQEERLPASAVLSSGPVDLESQNSNSHSQQKTTSRRVRNLSDPGIRPRLSTGPPDPMPRVRTMNVASVQRAPATSHMRSPTVDFAAGIGSNDPRSHQYPLSMNRTSTMHSHQSRPRSSLGAKETGFGGFPMPYALVKRAVHRLFPRLHRTFTVPLAPPFNHQDGPRATSYLSFSAWAGRNSAFPHLTHEQLEEIGGVEYQALHALLWIVGGYFVAVPLVALLISAPYVSMSRWSADFKPPALHHPVNTVWYSLFQVYSAFTNLGMSLVDQSMVPFQTAYPFILVQVAIILAGYTCYPIALRFTIWMLTKIVPKESQWQARFRFLLDHPRRCYIYLFPSHSTWFLLIIVGMMMITDWVFFLILDIGNPVIDTIPIGTRIGLGLLQASAVRAAGFATVTLSALAPAVRVLYVVMMYVSVYPIAMSVRSTNVYEERSLGLFHDEEDFELEEHENERQLETSPHRMTVWSRYLASHARRQLSFDMWWLGLALFVVCIIERGALNNSENQGWFNIFSILFELVSAYGTVGLSLGLPNANYSFSGALSPLSKLVVCAVMIRGRHRGLPVAIDRAVVFPYELGVDKTGPVNDDNNAFEATRPQPTVTGSLPRTRTRASNVHFPDSGDWERQPGLHQMEARKRVGARKAAQDGVVSWTDSFSGRTED